MGSRTRRRNAVPKGARLLRPAAGLAALFMLVLWGHPAPAREPTPRDRELMRQCFALARASVARGNEPFGALLVKNGRVVMRAHNTIKTDNNVNHHAELNLIAAVYRKYGARFLEGTTLYSSAEPCPMCCGGIFMAGVARVVYGLPAKRLDRLAHFKPYLPSRALFAAGSRKIAVVGPVLEAQAAALIEEYLRRRKTRR